LGFQYISGVQGNEGDNAQNKKNSKKYIVQKNMAVLKIYIKPNIN
jgi:hypothetical protein